MVVAQVRTEHQVPIEREGLRRFGAVPQRRRGKIGVRRVRCMAELAYTGLAGSAQVMARADDAAAARRLRKHEQTDGCDKSSKVHIGLSFELSLLSPERFLFGSRARKT